ncbi:MAG: FkbM family methyltransferase [Alistipes sp.]
MNRLFHKLLYGLLPLESYLRVVSWLFFICHRMGFGQRSAALEYVYHLPALVRPGDTVIDIGANLGYYARPLSKIVGSKGKVFAIEPVPPIGQVLRHNLRGCTNTEILPYALGTENKTILMGNDTVSHTGYFGTGQNFVNENGSATAMTFTAEMHRGSECFAGLDKLDFIKCDIEGYEVVVMTEMRALLARFQPTVLIETGGSNRTAIIALFTALGYTGYTLDAGREIPLAVGSTKDIIFRSPNHQK